MRGRFLAILNPAAGGGKCGKRAPETLERLKTAGLLIDVVETAQAGDGTKLAREGFEKGFRDFIAIGGDGTSFEVINGLFPVRSTSIQERITLGFLPLGTGNSFLRDFTNDGADYAISALIKGKRRPCDVVEVIHESGTVYFINIFSMGFVADVNMTRHMRFKAYGELGYVLSVLTNLKHLHPRSFPFTANGMIPNRKPLTFLSINNSRFTGGKMMMAPHADTSDGQADVIAVGEMGRFSLMKAFPKIFSGAHIRMPQISEMKVQTIDFDVDSELDVMIDGEALRLRPQRIQVLKGAFDARV